VIPKGIGKLNKYVSLRSPSSTQDETGEVVLAYTHYSYAWASIRPLSANEAATAKQINEEISYQATIRYSSVIKSEDRIVLDARTFEIAAIMNYDENDEYQILMLKEIK
jgi:SPP1 family predicted phage head-tail adaptor